MWTAVHRIALILIAAGSAAGGCTNSTSPESANTSAETGEPAGTSATAPMTATTAAATGSGTAGTTDSRPKPTTLPMPEASSTTSVLPAPAEIDFEFCETDAPMNANVVGETPDGPFNGRYAWFGWLMCNGEGLSPTLVIVEDPADLQAAVQASPSGDAVPTPSLEWYLFGACDPSGGWVGEGHVTVYMRTDGPWEQTGGQIEIFETYRIFDEVDHDDPPWMYGEITAMEGDFSISGDFTAAYCGPLAYEIGCE